MKEFIHKHYLLVTNVICFVWTALCFAGENFIFKLGMSIVFVVYAVFAINIIIAAAACIYMIIINIAAFRSVRNNRGSAVVQALLGGSAGAFFAAYLSNDNYDHIKAVTVIFNVHAWVIVWMVVSCAAYSFYGYP